jgi:hypothetical protein
MQTLPNQTKEANKTNKKISNTIKYEIKDDPFIVPIKFKKELPLNKNFFELKEV